MTDTSLRTRLLKPSSALAIQLHPGTTMINTSMKTRLMKPSSTLTTICTFPGIATADELTSTRTNIATGVHVPPAGTLCRFRSP
jgi:hypothetical protein